MLTAAQEMEPEVLGLPGVGDHGARIADGDAHPHFGRRSSAHTLPHKADTDCVQGTIEQTSTIDSAILFVTGLPTSARSLDCRLACRDPNSVSRTSAVRGNARRRS